MIGGTRSTGVSLRAPLLGAVWWSATVAAGGVGIGELTLVDAMLLLVVAVIVPAAIPLHPAGGLRAAAATTLAGLPIAPALLLDQGTVAGALVVPWVLAAGLGAFAAGRWWIAHGARVPQLIWPAAAAYLVVGALWLLADRLDLAPGGFAAPLVQLTAIHFHYAGFASTVLAGCAWRWCPHSRTAATAALLIVAAPPVIASGFAYLGLLQITGAALLAVGLWLLAWVTVRDVAPHINRVAGFLLVVSSIAVIVPMALAVQWAVGANFGTPALSIPHMVRFHGVSNALGFTLLGVAGWRLALADRSPGTHSDRPDGGRYGQRASRQPR